jgi:hypothetical protein
MTEAIACIWTSAANESTDQANTDGTLKPFYGIQKVSSDVADDNGAHWDMQVAWGTIRARLNPSSGADHGDYLHGKHRPRDYTHGCICDRSEVILNYLWNLANPPSVISVGVTSAGNFIDEILVKKNVGQKLAEGAAQMSQRSADGVRPSRVGES